MKEEAPQPWEAEVRRVVETHEFEYDPAAWAGMEQLLDGATPAPGPDTGSWWAKAWKWLLPSALTVGGLVWLALQQYNEPPSIQGSFPVSVAAEQQLPPPERATVAPATSYQPPVMETVQPLPVQPRLLAYPTPELPALPPRVLSPLPPRPLPKALYPISVEEEKIGLDFEHKRNRKALFPDVIENY